MDYHEALSILTDNDDKDAVGFERKLELLLRKAFILLPDEVKEEINRDCDGENNLRWRYLRALLFVLDYIRTLDLATSETFPSVAQYRRIKAAIEIATSMGIRPFLLPGIGISIDKLCPRAVQLPQEQLNDLQKYERLSFTVQKLADLFDEPATRPAVLPQLGSLLAGFLQLSAAPLKNPTDGESRPGQFEMSMTLHEKLTREQRQFAARLSSLVENSARPLVFRELLVILGARKAPKWLRKETRRRLVELMRSQGGVAALTLAVCEDVVDIGAHSEKFETIGKLIATPQGADADEYYDAVCSQLVDLLQSADIEHSSAIASYFINAMHEENPEICRKKILNSLAAPLLRSCEVTEETKILSSETEVTSSIENLSKCFLTEGSSFKCLPISSLSTAALPLFVIYTKIHRSASLLKIKIKNLLLRLLSQEDQRSLLFSAFLDGGTPEDQRKFGSRINPRFGPNGGVEITGGKKVFASEELADGLLDLTKSNNDISRGLFLYALETLSGSVESCAEDESLDFAEKKLVATKILSTLGGVPAIQESQIEEPQHILSFVKRLTEERASKRDEEGCVEVLYVGLMLVKVILTERKRPKDWAPFDDLDVSLRKALSCGVERELAELMRGISEIIGTRGAAARRFYEDLSKDGEGGKMSEFERALRDLADPLIPVRAHGLISMSKLVERSDPDAVANKEIILCFFQENLKHDDSFIYLAAINGLFALATSFPQKIIEILVQEFIDAPCKNAEREISPETRAKIGEVLVKITRALGETAPRYKNVLINGFLCGTRDPDPLLRASSLSCLGELCKVLGFRLGNIIAEVLLCIGSVIRTDKIPECRRAGVLVATLLLQGLGKAALTSLGNDLLPLYRSLIFLRDNDDDPVLRLHAQLAVDEFDDVVRNFLFARPALEKTLFLLNPST